MDAAMFQLFIGFCSGLVVGIAIFSHPVSRAMVIGLVACAMIGGIIADGIDGYLDWASYLRDEMMKFTVFWTATASGTVIGAIAAWTAYAENARGDRS
jgi:hypothetical protein